MSERTLLTIYKENIKSEDYDTINKSFLNIFKTFEKDIIIKKQPINEGLVKEIIEFGDYCFNIDDSYIVESKEKKIFKNLYNDLKKMFVENESFFDECEKILCSLDFTQVKKVESFYNLLTYINLDKNIKISYKDGFIFSYSINEKSLKSQKNILQLKSFIARAIVYGGVFICDFLDFEKDSILTSGFVFEKGEWLPLKKDYVKSIHSSSILPKQQYIVFNK